MMVFSSSQARSLTHLIGILSIAFACAIPVAQAQEQTAATTEETPATRGTRLSFGGLKVSSDLPVQVISDELQMDQNVNTAIFAGNVMVEQGDLKLNSAEVLVEYSKSEGSSQTSQITRITASGDVTMSSPTETAESQKAVYTIATREIVMTGDVVVTQGLSKVSGERMIVKLDDGTAVMLGRVKTTIDMSKSKATSDAPAQDASQ